MKRHNDLYEEMTKSRKLARQELFRDILFKEIEEHFQLDSDYILNKSRKHEYVWARQIGMYFLTKHTDISLSDIARIYKKNHATVFHARKVVTNLMQVTQKIKTEIKIIEKKVLYKMNMVSKKPKTNEKFYYVNFDNYTSVRFTDKKGMILTGFKDDDIEKFLEFLNLNNFESMKHKNTGHYILEQK